MSITKHEKRTAGGLSAVDESKRQAKQTTHTWCPMRSGKVPTRCQTPVMKMYINRDMTSNFFKIQPQQNGLRSQSAQANKILRRKFLPELAQPSVTYCFFTFMCMYPAQNNLLWPYRDVRSLQSVQSLQSVPKPAGIQISLQF